MIDGLYPTALDSGISPSIFWHLSLREIIDCIESFKRMKKLEQKQALERYSVLSYMIADNVAVMFSNNHKVTSIYELLPELFKEEQEEISQAQARLELEKHKERLRMFANIHNKQMEGG